MANGGVAAILERMEYCGHTVNFKTHRQSYKIKKTIENPPEQWKIFRNTHEAIVDEDTFQRVQELRRNKRRPARTGKSNLFSGVAYCADCGEKMYYCTSRNFENDRIISSALPLARREKTCAERTSSVRLFWKRAC